MTLLINSSILCFGQILKIINLVNMPLAMLSSILQETLTGFKWMGNVSYQLLQKGHKVLFAYEEAIGYMFGTSVLDKDGVSAAAVMAECAVWLYANGKTFASQLEACYQRYRGVAQCCRGGRGCHYLH